MAENKNEEILLDGLERVSQSAAFLGVSRSKIYQWIREGVLPSVKIGHSPTSTSASGAAAWN